MATRDPVPGLSVQRIREVLRAVPHGLEDAEFALMRDYHRILEIHRVAADGGVAGARRRLAEQVAETRAAAAAAEALPAGRAFATRRVAAAQLDMSASHRDALARLDAVSSEDEAAVHACAAEIEAALARLPGAP